MPQSTPERRARWGSDAEAIAFLKSRGFILRRDFFWWKPAPGQPLKEDERDAITYLIEEWDFGGAMSPTGAFPAPLSVE